MSLSSSEYVGFLSVQIILFVLGALANLVVIAVVWKHKQLHSFTNYFLVNLAAADLFTLLFGTAVDVAYGFADSSESRTPIDECGNCNQLSELEEILDNVFWLSVLFKTLSNLNLMCLAVGRYTALVKTFSSVKNILHRKSTIALLWGISVVGIIIEFIFWKIAEINCSETLKYYLAVPFSIISVIVLFVISTSVIVYCYGSIIKGMYFDKTILGEGVSNGTSDSLNKKILCRLTIVTVLSVLTTIPTVCFYIYMIVYDCISSDWMAKIYMSISTLDKIAATFNPVFYTLLNTSMRHAILKDPRHLKLLNKRRQQQRPEDGDEMENDMEERRE